MDNTIFLLFKKYKRINASEGLPFLGNTLGLADPEDKSLALTSPTEIISALDRVNPDDINNLVQVPGLVSALENYAAAENYSPSALSYFADNQSILHESQTKLIRRLAGAEFGFSDDVRGIGRAGLILEGIDNKSIYLSKMRLNPFTEAFHLDITNPSYAPDGNNAKTLVVYKSPCWLLTVYRALAELSNSEKGLDFLKELL